MNKKAKKFLGAAFFRYFVGIQVLLFLILTIFLAESRPVEAEKIEQSTITVEMTSYKRRISEYIFCIYSNSNKYIFTNSVCLSGYSNSKLYDSVQVDDQITISYYIRRNAVGEPECIVVDARSGPEIYRSIDEYYKSKQGVSAAIIVFFIITEVAILLLVFFYVKLFS